MNIINKTADIDQRLESLGLNETSLLNAVTQGYLARSRLTTNHPRIFIGYSTWAEIVASLRDQLRPTGWEKSDESNYELTINTERQLAIAIATGDQGTGFTHASPSNKCPKGANTVEAINVNNQLDLFADLIPISFIKKETIATWILLYYVAENEIRSELSLPSEIGNDGKIRGWKERIILRSIPLDGAPKEVRHPQGPDIDIKIKRRA